MKKSCSFNQMLIEECNPLKIMSMIKNIKRNVINELWREQKQPLNRDNISFDTMFDVFLFLMHIAFSFINIHYKIQKSVLSQSINRIGVIECKNLEKIKSLYQICFLFPRAVIFMVHYFLFTTFYKTVS